MRWNLWGGAEEAAWKINFRLLASWHFFLGKIWGQEFKSQLLISDFLMRRGRFSCRSANLNWRRLELSSNTKSF